MDVITFSQTNITFATASSGGRKNMTDDKPKFTPGPWQCPNYTDFFEIHNTDPVNPKDAIIAALESLAE